MNYTDFTIRARDWQDGQFKVEVIDSPAGRMREPEEVTYDEAALAHPLRNLEHKRIRLNDLIELGEALANMLLPPKVREMLVSSRREDGREQGLRVRLVLDDPQVANLPWEYLYLHRTGGEKGRADFLALHPRISLIRDEPVTIPPGSVEVSPPLKLVVGLSSPSDAELLDLRSERGFIEEALSEVDGVEVEFVEGLTVEKLESSCQGAHVFHFAGHGGFAQGFPGYSGQPSSRDAIRPGSETKSGGVILLENEEGRSHFYPAEKLALTLRGAGVRLAVLGACETGRRDGVNVWSGVAPALMRAEIPAAVAMQYMILDDSAIAFARRFYDALASGLALDEAVVAGRLAILNKGGEDDVEWGVPVLYMRSPDGVIFPEVTDDPSLEAARDQLRAEVKITQNVELNQGVVIGVKTDAIHGDVYGGDIFEVQVYALTDAGREETWRRFIDKNTPPYKFLSPYTARDRVLFKGRKNEVKKVVRRIGEQPLLVIHGKAGVGKTSLLAAGVVPTLIQEGALVVRISDYLQPVETIRAALKASAEQIPIALPAEPTLPALIRGVIEATGGTLVLIFDQFEHLFDPRVPTEEPARFIEDLAESLHQADGRLRVVIAVRDDAMNRLFGLEDSLPDLVQLPSFELKPLTRDQARDAIVDPLAELESRPAIYDPDLVKQRLLPELDALTPGDDTIQPLHLQIACDRLYDAAHVSEPPLINGDLYQIVSEHKGVEGMIAAHVEETLHKRLADKWEAGKQVLETMAEPERGPWVPDKALPTNGISREGLDDLLMDLVDAQLLVHRAVNAHHEYGFPSPFVKQQVDLLAGPKSRRRYNAEEELKRIWASWLARKEEALATRGQLHYLVKHGAHLTPEAVRILLMLRSAVARDEPAGPWLAWLRSDEDRELIRRDQGRELIRQLEEPDAADLTQPSGPSTLDKAAKLLGLPDVDMPDRSGNGKASFGPIAWSAVSHPDPTTRQTAALALTVPDRKAALDRLDEALDGDPQQRRRRKAELRGALADADPEIEKLNSELPLLDRAGIWIWRVRRRIFRDRHRIAGLTLGGAVGAGLGLAVLRGLIGIPIRPRAGSLFGIFFFYGTILGAMLTLGMALADVVLLSSSKDPTETPAIWRAPWHPDRWPAVLAVALGTLLFGIAHMGVAVLNGIHLTMAALLVPMGFVAGLGLSVALYNEPRAGWNLGVKHWLLRLGAAALAFILTQSVFIIAGGRRSSSLAIGWAGRFYKAEFSRFVKTMWPQVPGHFPRWFDVLAVLDAALVGIVLTVGIIIGTVFASEWLVRWRALMNRAGD